MACSLSLLLVVMVVVVVVAVGRLLVLWPSPPGRISRKTGPGRQVDDHAFVVVVVVVVLLF